MWVDTKTVSREITDRAGFGLLLRQALKFSNSLCKDYTTVCVTSEHCPSGSCVNLQLLYV